MGVTSQERKVYMFTDPITIEVRDEVFEYCRLPIDIEWVDEDDTHIYGVITDSSEISFECLYDVGHSIENILRKMSGLPPDW